MLTLLLLVAVAAAIPHSQQASPTLARRNLNLAKKSDDYWQLDRRSILPFIMDDEPFYDLVAQDEDERSQDFAAAFTKLSRRRFARRDLERSQNIPAPTFRLARRAN